MKATILVSALALAVSGAASAADPHVVEGTGPAPVRDTAGQPDALAGSKAPGATRQIAVGTSFSTLDTDEDGYISRNEAIGAVAEHWAAADRNADGKIDQSEFSAFEAAAPDAALTPALGPGAAPARNPGGGAMDRTGPSVR